MYWCTVNYSGANLTSHMRIKPVLVSVSMDVVYFEMSAIPAYHTYISVGDEDKLMKVVETKVIIEVIDIVFNDIHR